MKLQNNSRTFNLGDTSFRRKTLIDDYKILLPYLQETILEYADWNNESQAEFYSKVLNETDLFIRNDSEDFSKRGRTLTNSLVKIGLTNSKRKLSKVANNWLNGKILNQDSIEQALAIDTNNLVFTRQLLKLRVYDSKGLNYFYPFRVALEFVLKYQNVPQNDFLTLVHLIQPDFSNQRIKEIIDDYNKVANNEELFSEYLNRNFPESTNNISATQLFSKDYLDREEFDLLFVNRKTSDSQDIYFEFVNGLLKFKKRKTRENLNNLLHVISDSKLKTAFGFGKSIFNKTVYSKTQNIYDFLDENIDNPLLSEDNTLIYNQFLLSKKDDIVREYRDMTKRTFNLSGLLDFHNGLINATNKEIFSLIFHSMKLSGKENISNYEEDLSFEFYKDITISEILKINKSEVLDEIKNSLKIEDNSQISNIVLNQKEEKFKNFISTTFPKEKIIEILYKFASRDDDWIKSEVSESATVSTIYEYIIAIAWYYISSEKYIVTKSLNLTLDGNMRPLTHAIGGAGDIVIDYENLTLMLEVTLMNTHSQKRGEWEPVLRHATNLTVDNIEKNTITLFIANELDINTVNIWRAVASVPLKSSNKIEVADLVKIFPLKNKELLEMLENNRNEKKLLTAINNSYSELEGNFDLDWRNKIFIEADM
ncbi:AlwI family type II restriction endonuclease [Staphylococcus carnosus]|uniref:AlwI family type II restriction endonuclease n=1 Tax=Staphylococcus carnosus TaxID=1281 RepID=A0AAJ0JRX2_STACA|nr:AlwI family type II restriction endonuclease [Staphylococcus carnosus]KKB26182.1 hypothetical protein VV61_01460 [Staphylococcus carnosus]QQS85150.1 AlwI family type II restriction endonuclease [Staphylococcus carnosus]UTC00430.1 hypothetical protein A7E59_06590 [Staphylococcus carnosus]UTC02780.1 hypothetical protein A2I68_06195 [Staphylococcus carnosus]